MNNKIMLLVLIVTSFLLSTVVFAEEGQEVGYDIKAILPDNQKDKGHTYFDLKMLPGQKQTIEILINNTADEKATFDIAINQAYTNKQGFIDYAEADIELDKSLKYSIKDMVTYEKEVTIEPNESVTYPITIEMPDESFDGQIMAGIQVMKRIDNDSAGTIANKVGYILGLNLTETDKEIERKVELVEVKPEISFGKTSVVATLKNPIMEAYGNLTYDITILDSSGKTVRSENYDSGMQLAPNSLYDLAIDWEGKRLVAGDYQLKLVVKDAKENEWKFDEAFKITNKEARDINRLTVDAGKENKSNWYLIATLIIIVLVFIGILSFYFIKKKKSKRKKRRKK